MSRTLPALLSVGVRGALMAAVLAFVAPAPLVQAAPQAPFGHAGRFITDAQGRVVFFHGLNMVDKLPPYDPGSIGFDSDDVRFLAHNGFNTVRLGIVWKALEPQPGVYDNAYLARIAGTARLLSDAGIAPFIDFHQDMYNERFDGEGEPDWAVQDDGLPNQPDEGFPANYFFMTSLWRAYDHFWNNDPGPGGVGLQDRYAAAWAHVAAYFRSDPRVLGYDIFNEPFPGSQYATCANPEGCPAFDAQLAAFTKRVFAAMRQADPARLLWYEPNASFDFGVATHIGNLGDPNAGLTFHDYCLSASLPGAQPGSPGQAQGCDVDEKLVFQNADSQSQGTGDALLLSEFGGGDDPVPLQRLVDDSDQQMVSWIEWTYWNRDPCCARPTEGIISDMSKPPTGDNVKHDKLAVLERPYPQAVAGTPLNFGFETATMSFDLVYSPARAGGGTLAPGTRTEIFVPQLHYTRGYAVSASGARVVSPPGARLLELVNDPGAARVTIRLEPGGPPAGAGGGRGGRPTCVAVRRVQLSVSQRHGRVVRVSVFVAGRHVATVRGRRVRSVRVRVPRGRARRLTVRLVVRTAAGRRFVTRRVLRVCGSPSAPRKGHRRGRGRRKRSRAQ